MANPIASRSLRTLLALMGLISMTPPLQAAESDPLTQAFLNPPESTKPHCYWHWMDNRLSKEGLTRDLLAMKQAGIGAAYIAIIHGQSGLPMHPDLKSLTDPWWDYIHHAIREGQRIGVDIGLFNCPGWSQSGGPWVKPQEAMRYVTSTELHLTGPMKFQGPLAKPQDAIQEVAVMAFPVGADDSQKFEPTRRSANAMNFTLAEARTLRSIQIEPTGTVSLTATLEVSDDGVSFRPIRSFAIARTKLAVNVGPMPLAPIVISIPATSARHFRLTWAQKGDPGRVFLSPAARLERVYEKQLAKMYEIPLPLYDVYTWPTPPEPEGQNLTIPPQKIQNISSSMAADGTLSWDVPPGEWVIMRSCLAPTGTKNSPAPPDTIGYEVDKMNRQPLQKHFDAYVGKVLTAMAPEQRRALKYVVADSYEQGSQNWTDDFPQTFQKRYGYDPHRFLPVLSGRLVGSADQSERFLWDMRRLVADRISSEYVGGLRDLCHANNLTMWLENYGHWGFAGEFLQYGGASDQLSGEFWVTGTLGSVELRCAASAAHTYGKPTVWAEAFTGGPAFCNTPRDFKARGDWAFSEGINQYVLHVYIHQPDERKPGINAWYGTEFNRHNTWFAYSRPWIDYQRRCSVMLQAGEPAADVAYFISEDAPKMTGIRSPELPPGYDFDYINADVIEKRLSVKDGRWILPDGTSYRLLILPPSQTMRPELLKKLSQLVDAGGKLLGSAPTRSPSLQDYPACDREVQQLASTLWNSGKVSTATQLPPVLENMGLEPAIRLPQAILWKQRHTPDMDIFFIANSQNAPVTGTFSFRVNARTPEIWWPETGRIDAQPAFQLTPGRVEMPITLDPLTSAFVVFRSPATAGRPAAAAALAAEQPITGPWQVTFGDKQQTFESLIPWSACPDSAIKYHAGAATYRKIIDWTGGPAPTLDLGTVNAIAQVSLNGRELATLWKAPYQLPLTLQPGSNTLEVTVVNSWLNRLIGDLQPGVTPVTYRSQVIMIKAGDKLQESGLLGPVRLILPPREHR